MAPVFGRNLERQRAARISRIAKNGLTASPRHFNVPFPGFARGDGRARKPFGDLRAAKANAEIIALVHDARCLLDHQLLRPRIAYQRLDVAGDPNGNVVPVGKSAHDVIRQTHHVEQAA